jgi:hypothetical protein
MVAVFAVQALSAVLAKFTAAFKAMLAIIAI